MISLFSHRVGLNRRRTVAVLLISVTLGMSACGSDDTTSSSDDSVVLSCENEFDEIVALLRSGSPTFDYNPATDLSDLLGRTDVAMTGTIDSIVRTVATEPNEAGDDSWTTLSSADAQILGQDMASSGTVFSRSSVWALRGEPDPLANPVAVTGLAFAAFLRASSSVPGGLSVDVQGLFVSCVGSTSPALAVIEPLPDDARGLSIEALAAAVSEFAEPG